MKQNSDGTGSVAAGDPVGYWADKSTTGAHVTGSGTARPTLSATGFNSKQALVFNGSTTNLSRGSYTAQSGLSAMTRIAVCAHATNTVAMMTRVTASGNFGFMYANGGSRSSVDNDAANVTTFQVGVNSIIPAGLYADSYSNSAISFYSSGSGVSGTVTGTIPATSASGSATLHIGSNSGVNFFWNGPIAEYIIFNRALSRSELARVEAYLAQRWGISGVHAQATASSDPVGYWGDKSGNARHATQSTAGNRPRIASTPVNGRRVAEWHSGTSRMTIASTAVLSNSMSLFAVIKRGPSNWGDGGGGGYGSILNMTNTAQGPQLQVDNGILNLRGGSNLSSFTPSGTVGVTQHAVISGVINNLATSLYANAALVDSDAASGSAGAAASSTVIGAYSASSGLGGPLNAEIAELIAYNRVLTAAERQRLERYLAARWGITLAPQVSNADAQDWVNRVYANGGSVSASTASAVNQFCNDIDAAGIRSSMYRANLFCGTGLNACLVPLYRGPSLSGTQYGNTTDTNVGPFVSGDYSESNGLDGDGNAKYLNTGMSPDNMGVPQTVHLAAFKGSGTWNTSREFMGTRDSDDFYTMQCRYPASAIPSMSVLIGGAVSSITETPVSTSASFLIGTRNSASELYLWQNGTKIATGTANATTSGANPNPYMVFTRNVSGTAAGNPWEHAMRAYSIGLGLNDAQAVAYNVAMQAFQAALGRAT
jgi:hypothetical protein